MARKEELEAMDWQAIRDIAEEYDIKKPPTGWKDAIPDILEFEEIMKDDLDLSQKEIQESELPLLKQPEIKPVETKTESKPEAKSDNKSQSKFVFATEYYKAVGIPYCPECGASKQTDSGKQICAISNKDCKFIK